MSGIQKTAGLRNGLRHEDEMMSARLLATLLLISMIPVAGQAAPVLRGKQPITDQYIVQIKPDQVRRSNELGASLRSRPSVSEFADRRAKAHGARVERVFEHAIKGFSARMTRRQAEALAADPSILLVEEDQIITVDATETNATWGLDRIDQADLPLNTTYNYDTEADTVHVYVLDTGIYMPHAEFGGRASLGFDSVKDGRNGVDCHGHGTHVAGTIGGTVYGVAKGVKLYAVRVLNCTGAGTTSSVIAGIDWVTANHRSPAVANMSIGGGASAAMDNAMRNSIASGVTYVVAAGNEKADACAGSPARAKEAITVGASAANDVRAGFSNYGSCVDLFAPGVGIRSAWHTAATAAKNLSGTSMATPHAAGVAALYLASHPAKKPAEVEAAIKANAVSGRLSAVGAGSPNLLLQALFVDDSQPTALTNGTTLQNIAGAVSSSRYYTIDVPAGATDLRIAAGGGSGNADLYVRAGSAPTTGIFDCRSINTGNAESCVFAAPTAATYHVMLHASGDYSGVALTAGYTVPVVNQDPVAGFNAAADGLQVAFTDTSSDADGGIASWQWIFGDGGNSTLRNPSYTYTAAGSYTVSLTVTDDRGGVNTRTAAVTVTAPVSAPCTACVSYTGSLAVGGTAYQPDGGHYSSGAGIHEGWLQGPAGTNFDLILERWDGQKWIAVAAARSGTSTEHIRYNGSAGDYRWFVKTRKGSGSYNLWLARP